MPDDQPTLPRDLIDQGFKLVIRAPGQILAVSRNRGGTVTSATIGEVVANARAMVRYIEWREKQAEKAGR